MKIAFSGEQRAEIPEPARADLASAAERSAALRTGPKDPPNAARGLDSREAKGFMADSYESVCRLANA